MNLGRIFLGKNGKPSTDNRISQHDDTMQINALLVQQILHDVHALLNKQSSTNYKSMWCMFAKLPLNKYLEHVWTSATESVRSQQRRLSFSATKTTANPSKLVIKKTTVPLSSVYHVEQTWLESVTFYYNNKNILSRAVHFKMHFWNKMSCQEFDLTNIKNEIIKILNVKYFLKIQTMIYCVL